MNWAKPSHLVDALRLINFGTNRRCGHAVSLKTRVLPSANSYGLSEARKDEAEKV
jgi:hypothetical protein